MRDVIRAEMGSRLAEALAKRAAGGAPVRVPLWWPVRCDWASSPPLVDVIDLGERPCRVFELREVPPERSPEVNIAVNPVILPARRPPIIHLPAVETLRDAQAISAHMLGPIAPPEGATGEAQDHFWEELEDQVRAKVRAARDYLPDGHVVLSTDGGPRPTWPVALRRMVEWAEEELVRPPWLEAWDPVANRIFAGEQGNADARLLVSIRTVDHVRRNAEAVGRMAREFRTPMGSVPTFGLLAGGSAGVEHPELIDVLGTLRWLYGLGNTYYRIWSTERWQGPRCPFAHEDRGPRIRPHERYIYDLDRWDESWWRDLERVVEWGEENGFTLFLTLSVIQEWTQQATLGFWPSSPYLRSRQFEGRGRLPQPGDLREGERVAEMWQTSGEIWEYQSRFYRRVGKIFAGTRHYVEIQNETDIVEGADDVLEFHRSVRLELERGGLDDGLR